MSVTGTRALVQRLNGAAPGSTLPLEPAGGEQGEERDLLTRIFGEENPEKHTPGVASGKEPVPRPIGVRPGMPWQPREAERSHIKAQWEMRLLEALEAAPWLQDVAVRVLGIFSPLYTRGDSPLPPDVADPAGAWKFAAIGDYGAGTQHLHNVAGNLAKSGAELIVTAGDNVYPTGRWVDYRKNWEPAMGAIARKIPFMPALGNHDMYRDDLRPYFGHFPHLAGLPYYTYQHRNAQFFALDGDQDLRPGSAQLRWLEQELKASGSRWKVVYLHYPMVGSKLENEFAEIRESVQPLLKRYGVQLVIAGHEHNYLRSQPIDGIVHVLTGGGGQRVYPFMQKQGEHLARRVAAFHHVEVSVGQNEMVVRAIDEFGKRIDTTVIPYQGVNQAADGAALAARRRRGQARIGAGRLHVAPQPWEG